jgi:sulfate adenylyltransferase
MLSTVNHVMSSRQVCDFECMATGAFDPVQSFLGKKDYESVVKDNRLADGQLWPLPIMLDIDPKTKDALDKEGGSLLLRDQQYNLLGELDIQEIWEPDLSHEALHVFGGDAEHPAVRYLHTKTNPYYVSGNLTVNALPKHNDYSDLRYSPNEVRKMLNKDKPIVAFQTRNPMHRAHMELVARAAEQVDGDVLIHPVVGLTKPGDIDYHTRIKCYREVIQDGKMLGRAAILSLLPLAMRMAGPREALWHALIRKNYGATHFIVGRDHAGPGSNSAGDDFYGPYEARDFVLQYEDEIGIGLIPFDMMAYVDELKSYMPYKDIPEQYSPVSISGTEVRRRLKTGEDIPEWFTPPGVVDILRKSNPPNSERGVTLFFTGLSGSGKSTIVNGLVARLNEESFRKVTTLDGDEVRTFLSSELGFSKEHRDLNIKRIGYVASLTSSAGSIVLTAAIAPYREMRESARHLVEDAGTEFLEVFVDANVETCEDRDVKGLYKLAREGKIKSFTGISDPYETPTNPDIIVNTSTSSVDDSIEQIFEELKNRGYL